MIPAAPDARNPALALRAAFDLSFAQPPSVGLPRETLLAVRVAGDPYAIRIADVLGLYAGRPIVGLPSVRPEFLGIAAFRGQIASVYDLAVLLGYVRARPSVPRWMVLLRHSEPVAFAFDAFDSLLAIDREQVAHSAGAEPRQQPPRPYLCDAVRDADTTRPIIQLQSMLSGIQGFCDPSIRERSDE